MTKKFIRTGRKANGYRKGMIRREITNRTYGRLRDKETAARRYESTIRGYPVRRKRILP